MDQTANTTGYGTAAATGTTATTTQASEVWVGGIGLVNSGYTLGTPTNSFTAVANGASGNSTASTNAMVYAFEKIVAATGTANSGGTVSVSSYWSARDATFKAGPLLALSGSAAGNYTLTGMTGSVTITPKPLTAQGTLSGGGKIYNGTTTATPSGAAALQTAEAPGAGTTLDGRPYTGDTVSLMGAASYNFNSKDVLTATTITESGLSLTGAKRQITR